MPDVSMRDLVSIRSDTSTIDDPDPDWTGTAIATGVLCDIRSVGGGEVLRGRQIESSIKYVVSLRNRTDVTQLMRLEVTGGPFTGKYLQVEKLTTWRERGRPLMLDLDCTEKT
jgi:head-tail adaptor